MKAASVSRDTKYAELKAYVIESTGLAYYERHDKDFADRIDRRLHLLGIDNHRTYLTLLHDNVLGQAELDHLITELTIGETFFFRDEQQFSVLRQLILPELLHRNQQQKTLRVWSAGCSSGAEAYSLSIVLRHELRVQTEGWDISIVGTDVNRRSLTQAQEGLYEEWALRSTPADIRERCFSREGNHWRIADRYRQGVRFQYHNLVKNQAPSWMNSLFAFDLIFCRNVMIYFDRPTAITVVQGLRDCLTPGSWLVVGHADHDPGTFRSFDLVSRNGISVYRKPGEVAAESFHASAMTLTAPVQEQHYPEEIFSAAAGVSLLALSEIVEPPPPPQEDANSAPLSLTDVRALADAGCWAEAEVLCAALIEKGPLDPAPHLYQALIFEQMDRLHEAERALRRAVYLNRKFVLAHYHLGLLLRRDSTQAQAARQCFENVLTLLAGFPETHRFEHGDGICAADLLNLTEMNLEGL